MLDVVKTIITKRDGGELAPEDLRALVQAYTAGEVPDYQMSAFLMAAFQRGMSTAESDALVEAMIWSGSVVDLSAIPGTKVDKHSTGGVGDKISLILAPVVAAAGVPVPMISGHGLGHTGGTLDKLTAIPGFRTDLSLDTYLAQLADIGVVMMGQTDDIAPADKKLYALRDVTGTVEFIPFIAASIMSKKLAAGIDALVLDVKVGRGAFMKTEEDARRLAERLVEIGERFGKPTVAWITDMNEPLGYGIGNFPETHEAIRCLFGDPVDDVMELVYILAGEMIWLGGKASSPAQGRLLAQQQIESGAALDKFRSLIVAQGGDPSVVDKPDELLAHMPAITVTSRAGGQVTRTDSFELGRLASALGAGRRTVRDTIDPLAGITLLKKAGDPVQPGEPIARLHTRLSDQIDDIEAALLKAIQIGPGTVKKNALLIDRYQNGHWDKSGTSG